MREKIGKFDILSPLGEGAMGEVYLARDPMIGREVAVKVIRQDSTLFVGKQEVAQERFFREARAAGNLNHPNIVTVHEFGEDDGLFYIAMERVEGDDLSVLMEQRRLAPAEALEILAQVCDGLGHAHAKGVLHRDIKPSNIRVGRQDGRPLAKLMDFGIARQGGSDLTGTGTLMGTFGYMAPEYVQGGKASASADLFAMGVILYEALSGQRAFQGDTGATVLYKIVHEQPAALEPAHIKGLSPAIQALLDRALAKDPRWRFPNAPAFAQALRSALDPDWTGPGDWQEEATREVPALKLRAGQALAASGRGDEGTEQAPMPMLPAGPVIPAPLAHPRPARPAPTQAPVILTRPPLPDEGGPAWRWPVAAAVLACAAWGLWSLGRGRAAPAPPRPTEGLGTANQATGVPRTADPQAHPVPPQQPGQPPSRGSDLGAGPGGQPRTDGPPTFPPQPPAGPGGDPPRPEGGQDPPGFHEALRDVDLRPEQALPYFERSVRDQPQHMPSHALRLVLLHRFNRPVDFRRALEEARNAGASPASMERFPHFRRMLEEERRSPKLPRDVSEALNEGLQPRGGPPDRRPPG